MKATNRRIKKSLLFCSTFFLLGSVISGGSLPGSVGKIMGVVLIYDARVPDAQITVSSAKHKFEAVTDEAGEFTVEVPAGIYQISVEKIHFRRFESVFLKVKAGMTEMVNIHLEVKSIIHVEPVPPEIQLLEHTDEKPGSKIN